MTALTDRIAVDLRDYETEGVPSSGDYTVLKEDLREILTDMATGAQFAAHIQTLFASADAAAARTALGVGSADSPTFAALTVTGNVTFDTSTFKLDATNNRVGIGTASPSTGLDVDLAADFSSTVNMTGTLTIDTTLLTVTPSTDLIAIDTNLAVFDAPNDRVIFGHTAGLEMHNANTITPRVQIHGTAVNGASLGAATWNTTANSGAYIYLGKSRGTTVGTHAIVSSGDLMGSILFVGSANGSFQPVAQISAFVEGTVSATATPGRLVFLTTPAGAIVPTEAMRIDSANFLSLGGDTDTGFSVPAANTLAFTTGNVERVRLSSTGLVHGHTSIVPLYGATFSIPIQQHTTSQTATGLAAVNWSASAQGPNLMLAKSRSGVIGTMGAANSADIAGSIYFQVDDGTNFNAVARIYGIAEGAPSAGSTPGRLMFGTTPSGSSTPSERMRIDTTGFVSFGGDTDTGLSLAASNTLAFQAGGTEALRITSSLISFGDTNTGISVGLADQLSFVTGGSTRASIDSAGRLLIGAASAILTAGSANPKLQLHSTATEGSVHARWSNDTSGPVARFAKTRSASIGVTGIGSSGVSSGDALGTLQWEGDDNNGNFAIAASIAVFVDGAASFNDMPGRIVFSTSADGSASPTERMRIDSTGFVSFGDTDTGIQGGLTNTLALNTGGSERVRIDSSGRVIFGHSASAAAYLTAQTTIQSHSASAGGTHGLSIVNWSSTTTVPGRIYLSKSLGNAIETRGAVTSGTILGQIYFSGDDGSAFQSAATIRAEVDGTPSSDMPGRILFHTTAAGSTTPTERMRISSAGAIHFPSVGTTASAANAFLDNAASPANQLLRSTSSIRYKTDIQEISKEEYDRVLNLRSVTYRSKAVADDKTRRWYGFIAEEVAAVEPQLINYGIDPEDPEGARVPDGVQYERVVVMLVAKVKELEGRLAALEG